MPSATPSGIMRRRWLRLRQLRCRGSAPAASAPARHAAPGWALFAGSGVVGWCRSGIAAPPPPPPLSRRRLRLRPALVRKAVSPTRPSVTPGRSRRRPRFGLVENRRRSGRSLTGSAVVGALPFPSCASAGSEFKPTRRGGKAVRGCGEVQRNRRRPWGSVIPANTSGVCRSHAALFRRLWAQGRPPAGGYRRQSRRIYSELRSLIYSLLSSLIYRELRSPVYYITPPPLKGSAALR